MINFMLGVVFLPRVRRYLTPNKNGTLKCSKELMEQASTEAGRALFADFFAFQGCSKFMCINELYRCRILLNHARRENSATPGTTRYL